jgi:hypothetical protein
MKIERDDSNAVTLYRLLHCNKKEKEENGDSSKAVVAFFFSLQQKKKKKVTITLLPSPSLLQ